MTGPHNRTCGARAVLCGITGEEERGERGEKKREKQSELKKA
jgi:hypothetical protein